MKKTVIFLETLILLVINKFGPYDFIYIIGFRIPQKPIQNEVPI